MEYLINSIQSGVLITLRRIIRQDGGIVNRFIGRRTPLHYGADIGQLAVVNELLQFGAIQMSDSKGLTPLMVAAQACTSLNNDIVQALLENDKSGLDFKEHCQGATALTLAVEKGHESVVATLLGKGAKQLAKNNGVTPLLIAADKGQNTIIRLLLSHSKADRDMQHPVDGFTALHQAAIKGHQKSVEELIAAGAKLDVQTRLLWTPLTFACQEGHLQIVKKLLVNGADVNIYNIQGDYPINVASLSNHYEVVNVLLDYGCDPNTVSLNLSNCQKNKLLALIVRP